MPPSYREYALPAPFAALVDCVWFLTQKYSGAGDDRIERIPPDGSIELIVHLGDRFSQIDDRARVRQPAVMVVGVWTRSIALVAPAAFETVGVRLRPGCWSAFFDEPASLFTDCVTDARDLSGPAAASLRDRLGMLSGDRDRIAVIVEFLRGRLRQRTRPTVMPVGRILATGGRGSIDSLARDAGTSHRHLERAFQRHVGVSPKMLSRIVRFQHALRVAPDAAWADVAVRCGYADQSHLIRDFRQFAGETPASLVAFEAGVADYFRRR